MMRAETAQLLLSIKNKITLAPLLYSTLALLLVRHDFKATTL